MSLPEHPQSREEVFLSVIAGLEELPLPFPQSRVEEYLKYIAENGSGGGSGRAEWGYIQGTLASQEDLVNFVNSTVGTNTANYIYKTNEQGKNVPFDSLEELLAYSGTVTNNDYAFVKSTDTEGNLLYTRYKYNGTTEEWGEEYTLNNSSFTAAQWAAMNSGITQALAQRIAQTILGILIDGTELTPDANWKITIPIATSSAAGLSKVSGTYGITISSGTLRVSKATDAEVDAMSNTYKPIVPANLQRAVDVGVKGSANYKQVTYYEVGSNTAHHAKLYIEEID